MSTVSLDSHLASSTDSPEDAVGPRPERIVRRISPRWFTTVMGTGIVANAAVTLPGTDAGLRRGALVVWIGAAAWLAALSLGWLVHVVRHRARARGYVNDPVEAPFYGAPAMALLTVGAGALLVGRDLIGLQAALAVDWTLWTLGTLAGLASALAVPYLMFTRHDLALRDVSATWLMPVVPPMVSAATGALLVPYAPPGQARLTLLLACMGMFGLAAIASALIATLLWARLTYYKLPPAPLRPTLWILLGPLGQSITAAVLLARVSGTALPSADSAGVHVFALLYGVPVWGFAMLWLALVTLITVRTVREGLPFALSWWSFTFPLGTLVTGTSGLAVRTGSDALHGVAPVLFAALVVAWLIVAGRTIYVAISGDRLSGSAPRQDAQPVAVGSAARLLGSIRIFAWRSGSANAVKALSTPGRPTTPACRSDPRMPQRTTSIST